MTDFYVGQKVVCVNAKFFNSPTPLVEGSTYTITWVGRHGTEVFGPRLGWANHLAVSLAEVKNPYDLDTGSHFAASRFRPLEEKPDAIEWARQICRDVESRPRIDTKVLEALGHLFAGMP